jgi:hypothetical protein
VVERSHGSIELLGDLPHCGGTDRTAQDRQQGGRDLAGREADHEADEDYPVDVLARRA